jgi:hypothetical protein
MRRSRLERLDANPILNRRAQSSLFPRNPTDRLPMDSSRNVSRSERYTIPMQSSNNSSNPYCLFAIIVKISNEVRDLSRDYYEQRNVSDCSW